MRAGKLDQPIAIQTVPTAKSASGADIPGTPVTFAEVYASVRPAQGQRGEFFAADRENVKRKFDVMIRYLAGVDETMQIAWGARTLKILAVLDDGGRWGGLRILAEEQR
jgi:SPP1 family predicted phage head-tail adaptor